MSRFPSRSVLAGLALVVLPVTQGCTRFQTGGEVCRVSGRNQAEQDVVFYAMEWAYDKVDFGFCRNQKCLVEVGATVECDVPDIKACVIRHIQAANGMVVDQESEATLKLTSTIDLVQYHHQDRVYGADQESGEFKGRLAVTELGPGALKRVLKLNGLARKGDI